MNYSVSYYMKNEPKQVQRFATLEAAQGFCLALYNDKNCESYILNR